MSASCLTSEPSSLLEISEVFVNRQPGSDGFVHDKSADELLNFVRGSIWRVDRLA